MSADPSDLRGWRHDVRRIFESQTVLAITPDNLPELAKAIAEALTVPVEDVSPGIMKSALTLAISTERERTKARKEDVEHAALEGISAFMHLNEPEDEIEAALRIANPSASPERHPKAFRWSYARYAELETLAGSPPVSGFSAKSGRRRHGAYECALEQALQAALVTPAILAELRGDPPVSEPLPRPVVALLNQGESLADELRLAPETYVTRTLEQTVFDDLTNSRHRWPWAIVGDAGHGKSTLLVRIFDRIRDETKLTPVLISAAWFLERGSGRLTVSKMVAVLSAVIERSEQPVLLVDTADLLLHDTASLHVVRSLLLEAEELGVTVGLTTRPREAELLRSGELRRRELGVYDDPELVNAVTNLVATHLPRDDHARTLHDVLEATARGLPVAEICRSPLLLRLLFELADGRPPILQEVDVTRLYEDLWRRRVVRDIRSDEHLALDRSPTEDLSPIAGAIGLAFLAAGTPELESSTLETLTRRVLDAAALPATSLPNAIDTLIRRGILVHSAGRTRFFHQTVFEFAAAKSLANRPGPPAVSALLRRATEGDGDLFVGAVLEQLMLILASDPTAVAVLRDGVEELISGPEALQDIGLLVWTRQPALIDLSSPTVGRAAPTAVARAARSVPAAATLSPEEASHVLEVLWQVGEDESRLAVLEAFARLARRAPTHVASSIARAGVTDDYFRDEALTTDETRTLSDLALQIAPAARESAQRLTTALIAREARAPRATDALLEVLDLTVRHWETIGGNRDMLEEVFLSIVALPFEQATVFAIGAMFTAEWKRITTGTPDLLPLVVEVLHPDDDEPLALAVGKLVAVGNLANELESRETAEAVVDELWNTRDEQLRQYVDGTVFPSLLASRGVAGGALAIRLKEHLARIQDTSAAPSCARAVRILGLVAVPPAVVRDAIPVHWPERIWRQHEGLLGLLPPAAAAGNGPAQRVIRDIAAEVPQLGEGARLELRRAAINFATAYSPLVPVVLALDSTFDNAYGTLRLARAQALRQELVPLLPEILRLAERLVEVPAAEDDAAELIRLVASYSQDLIGWPQLRRYLKHATTSRVRSILIGSIWRLDPTPEEIDDIVGYLASFVEIHSGETPATRTRKGAPDREERVIEQARVAWLRVLTLEAEPDPVNWPTIRALALSTVDSVTPSLAGQDLAVVADYLSNVSQLDAARAQAMFIDLLGGMAGAEFAGRETLLWKRELHNAMRPHVIHADLPTLARIIDTTKLQSPDIAQQMLELIAETRYSDARPALSRLADHSSPSDLRQAVVDLLRDRDRAHGTTAYAEVLDIVRPTGGRTDS